jgi:hypothetical protein
MNNLPCELIEQIVNEMDLKTSAKFALTCKNVKCMSSDVNKKNIIKFTKGIFERIIAEVSSYNQLFNSDNNKQVLTCEILKNFVKEVEELVPYNDIRSTFGIRNDMCEFVRQQTSANRIDIDRVWIGVGMGMFPNNDTDKAILESIVEFMFGTYQEYTVTFGLRGIDAEIYHDVILNISFTPELKLEFDIQDIVNKKHMCKEMATKISDIQHLYLNLDGWIVCDMSDDALMALSTFIYDQFGSSVFLYDVSYMPNLRLYGCQSSFTTGSGCNKLQYIKFYEDIMEKHLDDNQMHEKLYDACWC